MLWLDGVGVDGLGPCVKDAPDVCPDTVRFYDFSIEDPAPRSASSVTVPPNPMQAALLAIHDQDLAVTRRDRQLVLGQAKLITGEDGAEELPKELIYDGASEQVRGNHEWEVVFDRPVVVRAAKKTASLVLNEKPKGTVVIGRQEGDWVKLAYESGYMRISMADLQLLRRREVVYEKLVKGSCVDAGMFVIRDPMTCQAAGFSLGYFDTEVQLYVGDTPPRPEGCYLLDGELWLTTSDAYKGVGVIGRRTQICSSQVYQTTTTTTTTATTSTATTATSSTGTTSTSTGLRDKWPHPSLFCFSVARATGYEPNMLRAQLTNKASIFSCDESAVFSNGGVIDFGGGWKTFEIPAPEVKMGKYDGEHVTTNSWLNTLIFMGAWNLVLKDGRFKNHDWVVKVDPDAVFFSQRLRHMVKAHAEKPGAKLFFLNCDANGFKSMYGALEVFSRPAIEAYFDGKESCEKELDWHGWGEDMYMQKCLEKLGVGQIEGYGMVGDNRCHAAPCSDQTKVAFHDFKTIPSYFGCWRESMRGRR